jgi:putative heme degradation protein
MTEAASTRHALPLDPLAVLGRVTAIGSALIGIRAGGALLEGIGSVESVSEEAGDIVLRGPGRETRIAAGAIGSIVTDQMAMKTIMPFIEIFDADGNALAKITALDGLERFDAAFEGIARTPLDAAPPAARPAPGDSEPADGPLKAAADAGKPVTLTAKKPGVSHRWTGTISEVSFSHGFLNLIQPDMHLHIRAGAIGDWREGPQGTFSALDADGAAIGLTLTA